MKTINTKTYENNTPGAVLTTSKSATSTQAVLCTLPRAYMGRAKRPPPMTTHKAAEAAAEAVKPVEAASSKSVVAIHSIYEKLSNELPTYQVLLNELGFGFKTIRSQIQRFPIQLLTNSPMPNNGSLFCQIDQYGFCI